MSRLSRPLVCPVLVGRERECADLGALLDATEEAGGTTVLVSGEAGIGKTRLLSWLGATAAGRGWRRVDAHCYEQDRGLAYAGVADVLRNLASAAGDDAEQTLRPVRGTIAAQFPGLTWLGSAGDPPPSADADLEKRRLFEGVCEALEGLAGDAPVMVSLEDLHWADDATLDWLAFLARRVRQRPALLALTYRTEGRSRALTHLIGTLERERLASEVRLQGLAPADVDGMVRAILDRPVPPDVLRSLQRLTDGVPFLVEEMLRSALAEVDDAGLAGTWLRPVRIPSSVQEAVTERLQSVSEDARRLLGTAAVLGDAFTVRLLGAAARTDWTRMQPWIRELVDQQLLEDRPTGEVRFRHALTREVVLDGLLAEERRRVHARIAAVLLDAAEASGEDTTERLAHHLFGSEDWSGALAYGVRAGVRSLQMHAPVTALEHLDRAALAAERGRLPRPAALALAQARAHEAIGDFEPAAAAFDEAVATAEAGGDGATLVDALLGLGLLWAAQDYGRARGYFDRAVDVAREIEDPRRLARALARLANWHSNTGDYEQSRRYLDEALLGARRSGDDRAVAETVDLLGMTCLQGVRLDESFAFFAEAAAGFQRLGDRRAAASPLATIPVLSGTYQTSMLPPALPLKDAIPYGESGLEAARSSGDPVATSYALWQLAFALGPAGQPGRARGLVEEALRLAEEAGHRQWALAARCVLGALAVDLLQPDEAVAVLSGALADADALGSDLWKHQARALLGDAYLLRGDLDAARGQAEHMEADHAGARTLNLSRAWHDMLVVEVALAAGDAERALALVEEHERGARGLRLERARARALLSLGRLEEARSAVEAALDTARAQGNVSLEWRLLADLAQVRLSAGERTLARAAADSAVDLVGRIADGLGEVAGAAFRTAALDTLPRPALRAGERGPGPLSARESEVARLVARGMTNRAIADRLVVSVRTVESHVASAMARLDLPSRAALAAWVVEHDDHARE